MPGGMQYAQGNPLPPFRGMSSPAMSPYPMGHVPPMVKEQCKATLKQCMQDLSNLKRAAVLNPNMQMTERWLKVLSMLEVSPLSLFPLADGCLRYRILEPMCILAGPAKGQQDWAMEVQMRELQASKIIFPAPAVLSACNPFSHGEVKGEAHA